MADNRTVWESGIEVARSVDRADGVETVTLVLTSTQQVPVLVRVIERIPRGRAVLGRRASPDPSPVADGTDGVDSGPATRASDSVARSATRSSDSDSGVGARRTTYEFDRLEYIRVLSPGEQTVVQYSASVSGGDDGDSRAQDGDSRTRLAAVVPLSEAEAGRIDPAVTWWLGDVAYLVSTEAAGAEGVLEASPGPEGVVVASDGGDLDLDPAVASASEVGSVPAVGVVVTDESHEAVARTVSRARARGHDVYVVAAEGANGETLELAADLGATVVPSPDRGGRTQRHAELAERARGDGQSGLVLQPVGAPTIDYERTASALDADGFAATAIPESWGEERDHPHVVVGVPAYNAAGTVGDVVRRAREVADVVVVVDDGSGDDTGDVARKAGAVVVDHRRNRGYGGALKTLFREADRLEADHLVVLDADGQHEPTDVPRLVEAQKVNDAEIVIGSRYAEGSMTDLPFVRRVGLTVINVLTNLSLGRFHPRSFVRDTQSGFRAYDRDAVASLAADPDIGDRMGASTDIIYHAHRERYRIHEVGTTIRYDVEHSSTLNPLAHGYDLVRNIAITLTVVHPFKTLGAVGSVLSAVGIGVALEGFALGIERGDVPFVKTYAALIVSLLGLLFVLLAIDYHTIKSHPYYRRTRD